MYYYNHVRLGQVFLFSLRLRSIQCTLLRVTTFLTLHLGPLRVFAPKMIIFPCYATEYFSNDTNTQKWVRWGYNRIVSEFGKEKGKKLLQQAIYNYIHAIPTGLQIACYRYTEHLCLEKLISIHGKCVLFDSAHKKYYSYVIRFVVERISLVIGELFGKPSFLILLSFVSFRSEMYYETPLRPSTKNQQLKCFS